VLLYTGEPDGKYRFDIPFDWGDVRYATLYQYIFSTGEWQPTEKIRIKDRTFVAELKSETPYCAIPSEQ
jgi:hypothetical protein